MTEPTAAPVDPAAILPQFAAEAKVGINSPHWFFEPYWIGDRLIARITRNHVSLTDHQGNAVDDFYRDLAEILVTSVDADQAVLDGIWTAQPFLGHGSAAERWAEAMADEAEGVQDPPETLPEPAELETRRAFVVVDVLELDGQSLADLPFAERRRLLSGLVSEGVRLRVTPSVRMPIGTWFHAWRENGFNRAVVKHANSRYQSGTVSPDWIIVTIELDGSPGMAGLFWKGRKKHEIRR